MMYLNTKRNAIITTSVIRQDQLVRGGLHDVSQPSTAAQDDEKTRPELLTKRRRMWEVQGLTLYHRNSAELSVDIMNEGNYFCGAHKRHVSRLLSHSPTTNLLRNSWITGPLAFIWIITNAWTWVEVTIM
ncbi:hypothetical protein J6590_069818 [Homalodisca vitripennis]|nr:hypothetical protein J6590_069818 [Homalodisca vitripennis]